ncbi:type VII secretion protein EssB/YukC [Alkalihalobacillus sp. 1P02AB]|uniref:type VII secretion protein EssB/YukC n=1 Tax=Alkalihalobacillus sp. 1P02AB TaxID=3132260 RepID=UPI0039A423A1
MAKEIQFSNGTIVLLEDSFLVELNKHGTNVQEIEQLDELKKPNSLFFPLIEYEMDEEKIRLTYKKSPGYFPFVDFLQINQKEKQKLALALLDIQQIEGTQFTTSIEPNNVFFRQDGKVKLLHRGIRSVLPPENLERKTFLYHLKCLIVSLFSGVDFHQLVEKGFVKGTTASPLVDDLIQAKSLDQLVQVLKGEYPEPAVPPIKEKSGSSAAKKGKKGTEKQHQKKSGAGLGQSSNKVVPETSGPSSEKKAATRKAKQSAKLKQVNKQEPPLLGPNEGIDQGGSFHQPPKTNPNQSPFPSYNHAPNQANQGFQGTPQGYPSPPIKDETLETKSTQAASSFMAALNRSTIFMMVGVLVIGLIVGGTILYFSSVRPTANALSTEMANNEETNTELRTANEELEGELASKEQQLAAYQALTNDDVEAAITAFEALPDSTSEDMEVLAQLYREHNTVESLLKAFALAPQFEDGAVTGLYQLNNDEANEALQSLESENATVRIEQARLNGDDEQIIAIYEEELNEHARAKQLAGNSYLRQDDLDKAREIALEREDKGLQIRILEKEIDLVKKDDDLDDDEKDELIEGLEDRIDDLS